MWRWSWEDVTLAKVQNRENPKNLQIKLSVGPPILWLRRDIISSSFPPIHPSLCPFIAVAKISIELIFKTFLKELLGGTAGEVPRVVMQQIGSAVHGFNPWNFHMPWVQPAAPVLYKLELSFTDICYPQARKTGCAWPPCYEDTQTACEDHTARGRAGLSPALEPPAKYMHEPPGT